MSALFNTKYYTYHTGTSLELNSCDSIMYFYSKDISNNNKSFQLSITSLSDKFKEFQEDSSYKDKVVTITRENHDDYFTLIPNNSNESIIKFDTVIYINSSGDPVGFTYFSEPQVNSKDESSINVMKLNFNFSIINNIVDFDIIYTLNPIWKTSDPLLKSKFPTTKKEIIDRISKDKVSVGYVRNTDDLLQLISSDDFYDVTDCGVLYKDSSYKFWIPTSISMIGLKTYTHFSVGYYSPNSDIYLYRWNDSGDYTVDSLINYNHFGILKNIISGTLELEDGTSINTLSGSSAIIDTEVDGILYSRSGYINLFSGKKYQNLTKRIIIDTWGNNTGIKIISTSDNSTSLGLKELVKLPGKYYYLHEKYGSWYKLKSDLTGDVCWSSLYGTAYFNSSDIILPFSDRVLFKLTESGIDVYKFTGNTIFNLSSSCTESYSYEYSSNIEFIDSIRRRPLKSTNIEYIKNSVYSFRGIIFYIDNDSIKYL